MWMTSSFRAELLRSLRFLSAVLVLAAWAGPCSIRASAQETAQPQTAPDAPRPARPAAPRPAKGSQEMSTRILHSPVEPKSVSIHRLDASLEKVAGREFLSKAEEPLAIEVQTVKPLGNTQRSAGPVIVLNGQNLLSTRPTGQQTLLAFLPDRKLLKETNTIAIVWLGDEQTRTKHPLTLKLADMMR